LTGGIFDCGEDVLALEIRIIIEDLFEARACACA